MSSLNRADIRNAIRFRGDYQNVLKFPDTDVNREIQTAFGAFWRLVDDVHQGWWDKEDTSRTTTNNVAFVAAPSDAYRIKAVDILDSSDYIELRQIGLSDRNKFGSSTDMPEAYRLSVRGAELYPIPNATYSLRFIYTPVPDTLDDAVAREWYTGWEEYVIEATLLALDKRERRPLGDRMASVAAAEAAIRSGASERRSQEPEYIPLREWDELMLPADRGIFR